MLSCFWKKLMYVKVCTWRWRNTKKWTYKPYLTNCFNNNWLHLTLQIIFICMWKSTANQRLGKACEKCFLGLVIWLQIISIGIGYGHNNAMSCWTDHIQYHLLHVFLILKCKQTLVTSRCILNHLSDLPLTYIIAASPTWWLCLKNRQALYTQSSTFTLYTCNSFSLFLIKITIIKNVASWISENLKTKWIS